VGVDKRTSALSAHALRTSNSCPTGQDAQWSPHRSVTYYSSWACTKPVRVAHDSKLTDNSPWGLAVSELARVAVGAEPDRVVVDVEVQLPPVGVGGKPHVAALGAGGCQGDLGLHGHESMSIGLRHRGARSLFYRVPPSRQTLRRNPLPLGRSGRLKSLRPTAPAVARRRCLPVDERRSVSTRTRSGLKRSRRRSRSIAGWCPKSPIP
jgi:hypothetical protein